MGSEEKRTQGYRSILTGEDGELCIQRLFLKWGWLPRKQSLDQGMDLMVEVGIEGRGAGVFFIVQSKATAGKVKLNADGISVPLSARNIEYLSRQSLPVLLMFVAKDDTIYWVDATRAIKGSPRKRDGGALIKISIASSLSRNKSEEELAKDREVILDVVKPTSHWMIPAMSIEQAIQLDESELSALDPRLNVRITAASDGRKIEVYPRSGSEGSELRVSIAPASPEDREKLKETIQFGVGNEIGVRSLQVFGSPLFERLIPASQKGRLTLNHVSMGVVRVLVHSATRGDGRKTLRLLGDLTRGVKGGNVELSSNAYPVRGRLRFNEHENRGRFRIDLDPRDWEGLIVSDLTGLTDVADWIDAVSISRCIELEARVGDMRISSREEIDSEAIESLLNSAKALRELDDLRELAFLYNPDLVVGKAEMCLPDESVEWSLARRVLRGGVVEGFLRKLSVEISKLDGRELDGKKARLCCRGATLQCTAFGVPLCDVPIDYFLSGYEMKTRIENERLFVDFYKSAGSVSRVRLASAEPMNELGEF